MSKTTTKAKTKTTLADDRLAYGLNELAQSWGVSRDTILRLIADGELERIKARTRVLIPKSSVDKFLTGRR